MPCHFHVRLHVVKSAVREMGSVSTKGGLGFLLPQGSYLDPTNPLAVAVREFNEEDNYENPLLETVEVKDVTFEAEQPTIHPGIDIPGSDNEGSKEDSSDDNKENSDNSDPDYENSDDTVLRVTYF